MAIFYKPNFCCNCGEKIERAEWKLWTSRRFCDICAVEKKQYDLGRRAAATAAVFVGIIGLFGIFNGKADSSGGRTEVAAFRKANLATASAVKKEPKLPEKPNAEPQTQAAKANVPNPIATPQIKTVQPEYICGAMTKKGTPCSRKVKTKGRCWQHAGQPEAPRTAPASAGF